MQSRCPVNICIGTSTFPRPHPRILAPIAAHRPSQNRSRAKVYFPNSSGTRETKAMEIRNRVFGVPAKKLFVLLFGSLAVSLAQAQDPYPSKPMRIIVPFAPGGGIDILGRTVGQKLSERWKQPVVIENRPGASGNIGFELAAKAPPDGYSILMSVNTMVMVPSLKKNTPYDPIKDFAPVVPVAVGTMALVVPPSLNVK